MKNNNDNDNNKNNREEDHFYLHGAKEESLTSCIVE